MTFERPIVISAPVRYAVVGLGRIAREQVLPAFERAKDSELTAIVSSDDDKLRRLGDEFDVPYRYRYDGYDACIHSEDVDAVYIALPNHLHCDYAVRAANAGKHVLCEKPMAVIEDECQQMLRAAAENDVRLMIAYRLHFEEANLRAAELIQSGAIGEPRLFQALFTTQVPADDVRLQLDKGGGTLYDIGVYCVNAARTIFRDEPTQVLAASANDGSARFQEVDEMTTGVLRFPGDRLASFTVSFGGPDISQYRVLGTRGSIEVEPAFSYTSDIRLRLRSDTVNDELVFAKREQFAAEIQYFSACMLNGRTPEPSGLEGWADVRVIQALYRSAIEGRRIALPPFEKPNRPTANQAIHVAPAAPGA